MSEDLRPEQGIRLRKTESSRCHTSTGRQPMLLLGTALGPLSEHLAGLPTRTAQKKQRNARVHDARSLAAPQFDSFSQLLKSIVYRYVVERICVKVGFSGLGRFL